MHTHDWKHIFQLVLPKKIRRTRFLPNANLISPTEYRGFNHQNSLGISFPKKILGFFDSQNWFKGTSTGTSNQFDGKIQISGQIFPANESVESQSGFGIQSSDSIWQSIWWLNHPSELPGETFSLAGLPAPQVRLGDKIG